MNATQRLHEAGQSLWLDNITRRLLTSGALRRHIDEFSITGLTSNPTIFDHAIKNSRDYDDAIRRGLKRGKSGEALFFDLALEDLMQAADLFRPVYDKTAGRDGWVSLEVSPLLAHDTAGTVAAAKQLHARAGRPNLFIKIPGTPEGLPAIEESVFAGVPVNVTLLFSREHYVAAAEAYLRGIERRVAAGLKPDVSSVASVFISRWDVAVTGEAPERLRDQLGIAIARRTYKAYRDLLDSPRSQRPQRRRPPAAPSVGQYRDEGPQGFRRPLRQSPRCAVHDQHHPRKDLESLRRPRRSRLAPARGRRRLRGSLGRIRRRWHRRPRTRRSTPGRRGQIVRQVLGRVVGVHRDQGRGAQECRLSPEE